MLDGVADYRAKWPAVAPNYETERLIARPWTPDDVDAAFAMYGDPEVARFLGQGGAVPHIASQRTRLAEIIEKYANWNGYGYWALEAKASGFVIGASLLKPLPGSDLVEVGWHLRRDAWGKGFATESARGALEYGFGTLGLDTVYAIMYPQNERSRRVAERLGMTLTGVTSEFHDAELLLWRLDRAQFIGGS